MMIFARRHEQDLAEIHALTHELDQRAQEGLERLRSIRQTQDQLAGRSLAAAPTEPVTASPWAEHPPVELTDEAPKRGGIGGALRQLVYGPEIDLPPSDEQAGNAAHQPAQAPDAQQGADSKDPENVSGPLAFVHIPKTAGGTVSTMLAAAYSKTGIHKAGNFMRGPEKTPRKIERWNHRGGPRQGKVSIGHVPYGVFREHLPPDTRYMTFLREPLDRVLSHYYRHIHIVDPRRAGRHVVEPWSPEQGGKVKADSIEQALVDMRIPQLSNLATRFLCGHPSPMGELPETALDDAKSNLRDFEFIGIQERFEESVVLLRRLLGLGELPYKDRHVSSDRPGVDEIPAEQRALIAEYNQLDAELYSYGLVLFEETVAEADDGFTTEVQALQAQSAAEREEEWQEAALTAGAAGSGARHPSQ